MGNKAGLDLMGNKYGKLTVIKDTGKRDPKRGKVLLCECECGNFKEVATSYLRHGNTKSCGCLIGRKGNHADLTGKIFGELSVLEKLEERASNNEFMWKCKCTCGVVKNIKGSNLKSGNTKSCGCLIGLRLNGSDGLIPPELLNVKSTIVEDGKFEVFENGRIFRIKRGRKIECAQTSVNKYKAVSTMVEGVQKSFYVHRLMALAFIPNPENKPQVNHKDGDRANNELSNLEWVTAKENVAHAYQTGLADALASGNPCGECGEITRAESRICPNCKKKINSQIRKEITLSKISESVEHIEVSLLTKRQEEIVLLRKKGKTYEQIGEALGITRQAVEQSLKISEKRMNKVGTLSKRDLNEIIRLNKRKDRINLKREKLLSEVSFIDKDLELIDSILLSYESHREPVEV